MITKTRLIKHLDSFPEKFTIDQLIDNLVFVDKLEKRIKKSKEDDTISEMELENEMQKWFK